MIKTKPASEEYRDNYDRIFRKEPPNSKVLPPLTAPSDTILDIVDDLTSTTINENTGV